MTVSILNLDAATVSPTAIKPADKANFVVIDTVSKENGRECVYQKITGDEEFPMIIRVGHYPNPKALGGLGQTNISLKISTFVKKEDNGTMAWAQPCSVTIASTMPGVSGVPDGDDFITLLQNAISWLAPLDSGVFVTDAVDEIKFGVVNKLSSHIDS